MKKHVVMIGGGASGLTAAIWAARSGAKVTVIEHMDRVGKKILATGNGRCNLTNSKLDGTCYHCQDPEFPMKVVGQFGWKDTLRWFASMGVLCKTRMDTYYYPVSDQASAILDALRLECGRLGVEVCTGCEPEDIRFERKKGRSLFFVTTDQGVFQGDSLVLACGSKALPSSGSDGSGYRLAESLGHRVIKPLPALVQLRCQGNHYRQLAGIRTEAGLTLYVDGEKAGQDRGELQFTDYGISGIPVFQLSRGASRALDEKKRVQMRIDLIPFMDMEETRLFLRQRFNDFGDRLGEDFLTGVLNKKLAQVLLKQAQIRLDRPAGEASRRQREMLLKGIKTYEALVSSANPFANAQVCSGGVDTSEVDPRTMGSKLVPELYLAGELLDVDGICGGYNLQWAWSSGKIAGSQAAQWAGPQTERSGERQRAAGLQAERPGERQRTAPQAERPGERQRAVPYTKLTDKGSREGEGDAGSVARPCKPGQQRSYQKKEGGRRP